MFTQKKMPQALVSHYGYGLDALSNKPAPNDANFSDGLAKDFNQLKINAKLVERFKAKTSAPKTRSLDYKAIAALLLLVVIVFSGISLVIQGYQVRAQVTVLAQLQAERDDLQAELTRLTLEQNTLTALERVETLAEDDLDMRYPATSQIRVVSRKPTDRQG